MSTTRFLLLYAYGLIMVVSLTTMDGALAGEYVSWLFFLLLGVWLIVLLTK